MRISDVDFRVPPEIEEDYVEYVDIEGVAWTLDGSGNLTTPDGKGNREDIRDNHCLEEILCLDFERRVDWSKVPKDTQVVVKEQKGDAWKRGYLAGYREDGKYAETYFIYANGATEWSNDGDSGEIEGYPYCELAVDVKDC